MIPIDLFVLSIRQKGINLWLDEQWQLHYKAPRGLLTSELQHELNLRKVEVIDFLRQAQMIASLPKIIPDQSTRYHVFPLTDIQEAYWLGRGEAFELNTPSHFYEEFSSQGLDHMRLEQAWQKLVQRHEMLRAVILPGGQQRILSEVPMNSVTYYDLTDADEIGIKRHLDTLRREMFIRPFTPEQWPLFRLCLTKLPHEELRIHFSVDMLIVDWSSYKILLREWGQLYQLPDQRLPDLTISFRDYVLAEKRIRETDLYKHAENYWQQRLPDLPAAPELPLAIDPKLLAAPEFKRHRAALGKEIWAPLKTMAIKRGLTPTSLLLTAFAEILTCWSKRPRFTINLTLFNRLPLAEPEMINRIVGDFTSLTMLVIDNANLDDTLITRAQRLQNQLWQDLEQRIFSGIQVLRALAARQGTTGQIRMPIVFTSGIGILNKTNEWLGEAIFGFSQTPQVWLDCQVEESNDRLWIVWDTVDALFPSGLIDTMFSAYLSLLHRLAMDEALWKNTSIDLLPVVQRQQRDEINNTHAPFSEELLHTLFIKQAITHPHQIAVITATRSLTYRQLYQEALRLAHWLRAEGASPNQLVAVIMEKGWEQVVAVIGILMSGAAYLPIDPDLPTERQHYLLAQSEARLLLTQRHLETRLDWPKAIRRFCVAQETLFAIQDGKATDNFQASTDLAYVIYTSGSTGQPKGVMIDHRGAVNTVLDINRRFHVTSQDRVLALSALHFDLSVYDIFGLLAAGGTIIMPIPEGRRDPSHWSELMTKYRVTLWDTVPALMQMMVEYLAGCTMNAPLRLVMMSGDWIPLDLPNRIRQIWPKATLMSLGGATEASIWSIYYPIETVDPTWKSIPYGVPLTNQSFQILNERLESCPTWVPGQLCIGGIGLALGYWRDEEKTREKFFIHPQTSVRLYNTGDLGRYLPDGNIEFLGREDFQVKIRGYRIELGEIESHLLKHHQISKCVVSAVGDNRYDQQLVAYVVLKENEGNSQKVEQTVDQAAYGLSATPEIISDPVERLRFRLNQPGIRQFSTNPPEVTLPSADVEDTAYLTRQSYRQFLETPIGLTQLGWLLDCLRPRSFPGGVLPKYRYGSAGSLYPVQTYLYIKPDRMTELDAGFYYYHPMNHRLVSLSSATTLHRNQYDGINQLIFDQAAFALFLVAEYKAIKPMYGRSARDFCMLEAGYISQLLMMESARHNLGLCPIGGLNFDALRSEFGLTDTQEMVHSFLGGSISAEQKENLAQVGPQAEPLKDLFKAYLRKKLPGHMVPNIYIQLSDLPLTDNGKVDRKALPKLELTGRIGEQPAAPHIQPSSELELRLSEVVKTIFAVHSIGLRDNFYDFGVNSLDMVQLYNAIQVEFQCEITMTDIFNHTTIQALAAIIEKTPRKIITSIVADVSIAAINSEEIDRITANLENLSEFEVEQLLTRLEQE